MNGKFDLKDGDSVDILQWTENKKKKQHKNSIVAFCFEFDASSQCMSVAERNW
jgi:hypothetical protein